jgi:predicted nucleic acid-binding protein
LPGRPLYLDTSAVLRAVLESGASPEVEERIAAASFLLTSRLSLVESARALLRLRQSGSLAEARLADAEREMSSLWSRCEIFELSAGVCELARGVAPTRPLRALDALHVATFVMARRRIGDLELLTVDERMRRAVELL